MDDRWWLGMILGVGLAWLIYEDHYWLTGVIVFLLLGLDRGLLMKQAGRLK